MILNELKTRSYCQVANVFSILLNRYFFYIMLPFSTVAHKCHGKREKLSAKEKLSQQKKKRNKENTMLIIAMLKTTVWLN